MSLFKPYPRASAILLTAALLTFGGCETKERIVDVEAPGVNVEVDREPATGKVDVEADVDRRP